MPDARHHGHGTGGNGARQPTIVEGHEILEGTAAAHEEHHLSAGKDHLGQTVHEPVGRPGALHGNAGEQDAGQRIAPAQGSQHVVDGGAARRGDEPYGLGIGGQRTLAGRIHQSHGLELPRQVGHLQPQLSFAGQRHREHVEVHAPLGRVQRETPGELHQGADGKRHA